MHTRELHHGRFSRRSYLKTGLLSGALLFGWSAAGCAWGDRRPPRWGGWHRHHWDADPAAVQEHFREAARWLMTRIDASKEQQQRVDEIVVGLADDVMPLMRQHRDNRNHLVAALTAESVDRATIDRLRDADLELAQQAYSRFTSAIVEVAEILTPAQRVELAGLAEHYRRWR